MAQFRSPILTAYNSSGNVLPGAKLYFYTVGTTTFKDTYANARLTIKNTNPVLANSWGLFPDIFLGSGNYKMILKDKDDNQIWSIAELVNGSENTVGYD